MKRLLSFTLIITIIFSSVPLYGSFGAFAEDMPEEEVAELFAEDLSEIEEVDLQSDEDFEAELFADNAIPEIGEIIYENDFSGTSLDSRIVPQIIPDGGGSVSISDSGELEINSVTSTVTGAYVYVNADKTGVTSGEYVTQFKITRPDTLPVIQIHAASQQDKSVFSYVWGNATSGGNFRYSDTKGKDNTGNIAYKANNDKTSIVVTMKIDIDDMKFWLWFDSTLAVNGKYPRQAAATNLCKLRFYTEGAGLSFAVDDIKFYTPPGPSDSELLKKDYDRHDFDYVFGGSANESGVLKADVNLPTIGMYGSQISWLSSDEKLLSNSGKLTYADSSYETNPEITLTATFTLGGESLTRVYAVRIISQSEIFKGSGIPEIGEIIYEDNFSSSELDERVQKNIPTDDNGEAIGSVEVADGELKINYNADAAKSGAVCADIYANKDKSALKSGRIVTQFKLTRPSDKPLILFRVLSGTNQNLLGFN